MMRAMENWTIEQYAKNFDDAEYFHDAAAVDDDDEDADVS